jgi:membrane-associated protein
MRVPVAYAHVIGFRKTQGGPPLPISLDTLLDAFHQLDTWIQTLGYVGLFIVIFVETGLFLGFFLPGDTLLLTAGLLAERGHFDIRILIPLLIVAAVTGDATGYAIGRRAGPMLFVREDARFFRRRYLVRAHEFFERHGGKAIFLARFLAILRTFAPVAAGAAGMPYRRFSIWNIAGGVAWIVSMVGLGYTVGNALPGLDLLLIVVVFLVSIVPFLIHQLQERRRRRA